MGVSNDGLWQGTLRDAIPPGCASPWYGGRAGSVLFSPVGSDTTVGGGLLNHGASYRSHSHTHTLNTFVDLD